MGTDLLGDRKKSFLLYYNGGEIWFEHLEGLYEYEDLVTEKLNSDILKSYNYKPSVKGGYDAIVLSSGQLAELGVLDKSTNPEEFAKNSYIFFDDVKDTYSAEESLPPKFKKADK